MPDHPRAATSQKTESWVFAAEFSPALGQIARFRRDLLCFLWEFLDPADPMKLLLGEKLVVSTTKVFPSLRDWDRRSHCRR